MKYLIISIFILTSGMAAGFLSMAIYEATNNSLGMAAYCALLAVANCGIVMWMRYLYEWERESRMAKHG